MAIHVDKTIGELADLCNSLGIIATPSSKSGKFKKEDYIIPLREYHLIRRYKTLDKVPTHLQLVLAIKSPMLAKRIDSVKEDIVNEVWESENWGLEEKLDGVRILIVKTNEGLFLYSRHNSVLDFLPIEYTDHILLPPNFDLDKIADNFILDVELTSDIANLNTTVGKYGVITETQLQAVTALLGMTPTTARMIQERESLLLTFNSFDCIYFNNSWITNESLLKRKSLALELINKLYNSGFKILPVEFYTKNKREFHKKLLLKGIEGTIAKHINSIYVPDTTRRNDGWLKIKRSVSQMSTLDESIDDVFGDTIDGWISGFEPGSIGKGLQDFVGTIKVSIYVRRSDGSLYEHEIAHISGFDMNIRQDMTEMINGKPNLKASYYNRIVEIDGQDISARAHRLTNAVLVGFRYDKSKDSCVIDQDFLERQLL